MLLNLCTVLRSHSNLHLYEFINIALISCLTSLCESSVAAVLFLCHVLILLEDGFLHKMSITHFWTCDHTFFLTDMRLCPIIRIKGHATISRQKTLYDNQ